MTWRTCSTVHRTTDHGTACSDCASSGVTPTTRPSPTPSSTSSHPCCHLYYSCSSSVSGGIRPRRRATSRPPPKARRNLSTRPYSLHVHYPSYRPNISPSRPRHRPRPKLRSRGSCSRSLSRRTATAHCAARSGRTRRYCLRDGSCVGSAGGTRWKRRARTTRRQASVP